MYFCILPTFSSTKAKTHNTNCEQVACFTTSTQNSFVLQGAKSENTDYMSGKMGNQTMVTKTIQIRRKYSYQNSVTSAFPITNKHQEKHTNTQISMQSCLMLTAILCRV